MAGDPGVQAIVDDAVEQVAPLVSRVVNMAATDLLAGRDGGANAAGESPLGNLIADAQRAEMDTQFAFMNPGGIRGRIQAGEVTWGELFAVQPFANDLVKMDLTGAQVWTLLGQQFQTPSNRILEISGLHYRYHLTSPTTGVIDAVFVGPPGDDSTPVPNDASVTYSVTVNSFLAGGGDGFTVLRDGTNRVVGPVDLDALVEYIEGLPTPFTSQIEGRIELHHLGQTQEPGDGGGGAEEEEERGAAHEVGGELPLLLDVGEAGAEVAVDGLELGAGGGGEGLAAADLGDLLELLWEAGRRWRR